MRSKVGFAAVWVITTAAGVAISWTGVSDAVRSTAATSPELSAGIPVHQGRPPSVSAAPAPSPGRSRPAGTPSPRRTSASPSPSTSPKRTAPAGAPSAGTPAGGAPSGGASAGEQIRTYTVRHGRVTLAIGRTSARLISTSPASGYKATVWRKSNWLRVDLADGQHGSAVFATWHAHAPLVEIYEY
ncbi:hypothetical protein [Actinomadura hibisca]|uniref:hypothetical protein n=1 Tax=Actinomadura hibisca TaxID=68565 RepID=UPI000831098E|nr:hypothetical protein [Actinomadura hibisca]